MTAREFANDELFAMLVAHPYWHEIASYLWFSSHAASANTPWRREMRGIGIAIVEARSRARGRE